MMAALPRKDCAGIGHSTAAALHARVICRSIAMNAVPDFEFGHVEQSQRSLGLDAMIILQDAQHFRHVVNPTFPGRPTAENVTQWFDENAGQPDVQRRGKAHLLGSGSRSEEHTSELQSRVDLVCRLLLEKKKTTQT